MYTVNLWWNIWFIQESPVREVASRKTGFDQVSFPTILRTFHPPCRNHLAIIRQQCISWPLSCKKQPLSNSGLQPSSIHLINIQKSSLNLKESSRNKSTAVMKTAVQKTQTYIKQPCCKHHQLHSCRLKAIAARTERSHPTTISNYPETIRQLSFRNQPSNIQ